MLDSEWTELLTQLSETRGSHTRFFSFVDTISARNFAGTNEPHGWVGLRFQLQPGGPANDILLHINMLDPGNVLEQEAIGTLGVNLIYSAFYELESKESFLEGVAQDVVKERIEIDYIDVRGPAFETWDRRTLLVYLVSAGYAEAVFFSSKGLAVPPTEALYKKAVCLRPNTLATWMPNTRKFTRGCWLRVFSSFRMSWAKHRRCLPAFFALQLVPSCPTNRLRRSPT